MKTGILLFLRMSLAFSFLSAVADRFGVWPEAISVWGNWKSFKAYTALLNPWFPEFIIPTLSIIVTAAEIILAICLIFGLKTAFFARLSGFLLLVFAFAMTFSTGIKGAFDYSVFTAAAAAFALSFIEDQIIELDNVSVSE